MVYNILYNEHLHGHRDRSLHALGAPSYRSGILKTPCARDPRELTLLACCSDRALVSWFSMYQAPNPFSHEEREESTNVAHNQVEQP